MYAFNVTGKQINAFAHRFQEMKDVRFVKRKKSYLSGKAAIEKKLSEARASYQELFKTKDKPALATVMQYFANPAAFIGGCKINIALDAISKNRRLGGKSIFRPSNGKVQLEDIRHF